jgi:hypothetical protein
MLSAAETVAEDAKQWGGYRVRSRTGGALNVVERASAESIGQCLGAP